MTQYLISLPKHDNDGNSTRDASALFIGSVLLSGGKVRNVGDGFGIWYGDDGQEYTDSVSVFVIDCNAEIARDGAIRFGIDARQEAVLLVPVVKADNPYTETARGIAGARYLAKKHGGATVIGDGTPEGLAFSVDYAAVTRGVEYDF